jgi:hypothetical protein
MVLNLSFFSSSSESSTLIRPISITNLFCICFNLCARCARVRCSSNKQIAQCQVLLLFLLSLYIHPFLLILVVCYVHTRL